MKLCRVHIKLPRSGAAERSRPYRGLAVQSRMWPALDVRDEVARQAPTSLGHRVVGTQIHYSCEKALPFGQGGIASAPGDHKGGRSSPLSDLWSRSDHQHRWRSPALGRGGSLRRVLDVMTERGESAAAQRAAPASAHAARLTAAWPQTCRIAGPRPIRVRHGTSEAAERTSHA